MSQYNYYKKEIQNLIFGKIGFKRFEYLLLNDDNDFKEYCTERQNHSFSFDFRPFIITKFDEHYNKNFETLFAIVQYPHEHVVESMKYLSIHTCQVLPPKIIENYQLAIRVWNEIQAFPNDPIGYLKCLMQTNNFICIERNARFLLFKNPFNLKLRKMYFQYLEDKNAVHHVLKTYQWLCRICFKDEHLIKKYRKTIIKFGCKGGENVGKFWIDTIEFERVFVSNDAARKILLKSLTHKMIGAKALFKYAKRFEKKYGNLKSLAKVEKMIEKQRNHLFEFEKKILKTRVQKNETDEIFMLPPELIPDSINLRSQIAILQNLNFPQPILSYIFKKASPLIIYNLFSTCKVFWNYYTPINKLHVTPEMSYNIHQYSLFISVSELKRIKFNKVILTNSIEFFGKESQNLFSKKRNIFSKLMPKIYQCHLRSIEITFQNFSFLEYMKLTASGNVEILKLIKVVITDSKGEVAKIEDLLFSLLKIEEVCITDAKITKDSGAKLFQTKFERKIECFTLGLADENINIFDFCKFIHNSYKLMYLIPKKFGHPAERIIYLTSSDLNKLSRDIYRKAYADDVVTSTYVASKQESGIISQLLDVIKEQTVHSNDLTKEEWNSVFWNDIFSRPDVQTEYFNEVLKYDEGEKVFKYNETKDNEFREYIYNKHYREADHKKSGSLGFTYKGFVFNGSAEKTKNTKSDDENTLDTNIDNKSTISFEDLKKHLRKNNVNVRWTGTKFTPKNLLLYRLNTKNLKSSGEVFYKIIVTTKFESAQKIEIRPEPQKQANFDNTISPAYYEDLENKFNGLKQELYNATTAINELKKSDANIQTSISNQINAVNGRLTNTDNNIVARIKEVNTHITNTANILNVGINQNVAKHDGLRNEHNTLRNEYNELNRWTRNDLHNYAKEIYKHADIIWTRTFKHGTPHYVKEAYKSRWGEYPKP